MKHNNAITKAHLRKNCEKFVRTWFNQAGRKARRLAIRKRKAAAVFPRPIDKLRPSVRCQTQRYNIRMKLGKGFTLEEIKAAGLTANFARTIGISVDHRRRNKSQESLELNKKRLLAYLNKLVLFPKKEGDSKSKAFPLPDASAETLNNYAASQAKLNVVLPVDQDKKKEKAVKKAAVKKSHAYKTLRLEQMNQKWAGIREKRAKEAAENEK